MPARRAARNSSSGGREARVFELAPQPARPELEPGHPLVQVLARPLREAGVDGVIERHDPFGDAAGRGDDDGHHRARVEQQDLDVPHRRRLERRRGHQRELTGDTREHLGRRLERRVDLAAQLGEVERERAGARILTREQLVRVEAVALLGRNAAGRCVRMREQILALRAPRARCARSTATRSARRAPRGASSRRAGRSRRTPRSRARATSRCRAVRARCWIRRHLQEF